MEVRHMRYFLAVAEALHFRHAAETLGLSQPALSLQIQQLEEELGVKLLKRSTRNVQLTRAGESLLARIRAILTHIDDAISNTKRVSIGLEVPLSISYVTTALDGTLPRAMRQMQIETPGIEFEMNESRPQEQIARLLQDRTDIGFMHVKIEDAQLETRVVDRYEFMAALPADLGHTGPVDLRKFREYTAIMPSPWGSTSFGMFNHVQRAYQLAGMEPSTVIHATVKSGLRLVAAGIGISVIPSPAETVLVEGVKLYPLTMPPQAVDLLAVWKRNPKSQQLLRLLEILTEPS